MTLPASYREIPVEHMPDCCASCVHYRPDRTSCDKHYSETSQNAVVIRLPMYVSPFGFCNSYARNPKYIAHPLIY